MVMHGAKLKPLKIVFGKNTDGFDRFKVDVKFLNYNYLLSYKILLIINSKNLFICAKITYLYVFG